MTKDSRRIKVGIYKFLKSTVKVDALGQGEKKLDFMCGK